PRQKSLAFGLVISTFWLRNSYLLSSLFNPSSQRTLGPSGVSASSNFVTTLGSNFRWNDKAKET
ncbi:hypothetical protein, partial [Herbaspirillum rhizosphaerae]|uniref:hypothetical protein n=1 Tax=Herbaspirillum rhizosphaerae TaxID=346179 RepID=UPI001969C784